MPKQITQAELRAVLEQNESLNQRILKIRARLANGTAVEPGELTAQVESEDQDYRMFAGVFYTMGLTIEPVSMPDNSHADLPATPERKRAGFCVIQGGKPRAAGPLSAA